MEEALTDGQVEALLSAAAVVLLAFTSWLAGRRARRVLGKALGREIQEGEETSLRAWMSVPTETLATVDDQLRSKPAEQVLAVLDTVGRRAYPRYTSRYHPDDHQPYSDHLSIR